MITDNPNGKPDIAIYTALLTQSGTDAPTVKILNNTFGETITWTRNTAGRYYATKASGNWNVDTTYASLTKNQPNAVADMMVQILPTYILVFTGNTDTILDNTCIEIRQYNENFI